MSPAVNTQGAGGSGGFVGVGNHGSVHFGGSTEGGGGEVAVVGLVVCCHSLMGQLQQMVRNCGGTYLEMPVPYYRSRQ